MNNSYENDDFTYPIFHNNLFKLVFGSYKACAYTAH